MRIDAGDLEKALKVLKTGGVILYPTETVWGIGCDATVSQAVERVFEIKGRASSKAMISLVADLEQLSHWLKVLPQTAVDELQNTERPTTIVYDSPSGISPLLLAEDGSAAFRVTTNPYTAELCRRLGRPLVSTSANSSGNPSPSAFEDIEERVRNAVDFICSPSEAPDNVSVKPSRIIKISNDGDKKIIRE